MRLCSINGCNPQQNNKNECRSQQNFTAAKELDAVERVMFETIHNPATKKILNSTKILEINEKINQIGTSVIKAVKKSFNGDSTDKIITKKCGGQVYFLKNDGSEKVLGGVQIFPSEHGITNTVNYIDFEADRMISFNTIKTKKGLDIALKNQNLQ